MLILGLLTTMAALCLAENAQYQITLDSFDSHSDMGKDYVDPGSLRIVRKGRNNFVLSGNFTIFKNMGDEIIIKCVISRKGVGGKMEKVSNSANPLCQQIQPDEQFYPQIAKVSNFPMPAPCPFPKDEYSINNFKVDEEFLPATLPMGEYLVEVDMILDDVVVFGYKVHATIEQ